MEEQTVHNKEIKFRLIVVAVGLLFANSVYAFDMGNMMNPSKWMDNDKDKDRYDDYYDEPGYGYPGGPPGYGYGAARAMAVLPYTVHRARNPEKQKSDD